jgi:hypothetical protein
MLLRSLIAATWAADNELLAYFRHVVTIVTSPTDWWSFALNANARTAAPAWTCLAVLFVAISWLTITVFSMTRKWWREM